MWTTNENNSCLKYHSLYFVLMLTVQIKQIKKIKSFQIKLDTDFVTERYDKGK